ncbi:ATP-binding protein [candidate division KSB1 bacterium]|nr:ATP-binding protein [candidate division KSB1 bacterium]
MIITIASGKGGTGKTSVAVNLAQTAISAGQNVQILDADVEAPNMFLFLDPKVTSETTINALVPSVEKSLCTLCGACADVCEFHAIGVFGTSILVFPELCHSCGGCTLVCPEKAITEIEHPIGLLRKGQTAGSTEFVEGRLKIGEAKAPPIIREAKKHLDRKKLVIIDAPPGNSCPVVEAMKASDFIILVTEPTPFGLHDLRMIFEIVREMNIPFGLVINKAGLGNRDVYRFCDKKSIPILLEIPFRQDLASSYASGEIWINLFPDVQKKFISLLGKLTTGGKRP